MEEVFYFVEVLEREFLFEGFDCGVCPFGEFLLPAFGGFVLLDVGLEESAVLLLGSLHLL